jgi:hypothetical protein
MFENCGFNAANIEIFSIFLGRNFGRLHNFSNKVADQKPARKDAIPHDIFLQLLKVFK